MAAGDIDDTLGPEGRLYDLRQEYPELDAYLNGVANVPIDHVFSIPFGAGIAHDGSRVYIDHRLDYHLDGIDLSPALRMHECVEWALREFCHIGENYEDDPRGHRLANRAESEVVRALGLTWEAYADFIDPQVRKIENATIHNPPTDLAMYPYEDTPFEGKILAAMASGKVSKAEAGYTPQAAMPSERCELCEHFIEPDECSQVQGEIAPDAWCELFEPKEALSGR